MAKENKKTKEFVTDVSKEYDPNVTKEDLDILKEKNIHKDGGDDQQLRNREENVDFAGEELDVPGRKQAKETSDIPLTDVPINDEENKLHSQGGPRKRDLEERDGTIHDFD